MKLIIEKEKDWSDFTSSDPLGDIREKVKLFGFNKVCFYLTPTSIGHLFSHPDTCRVYKHDWKYLFHVDKVELSTTGYDYLDELK